MPSAPGFWNYEWTPPWVQQPAPPAGGPAPPMPARPPAALKPPPAPAAPPAGDQPAPAAPAGAAGGPAPPMPGDMTPEERRRLDVWQAGQRAALQNAGPAAAPPPQGGATPPMPAAAPIGQRALGDLSAQQAALEGVLTKYARPASPLEQYRQGAYRDWFQGQQTAHPGWTDQQILAGGVGGAPGASESLEETLRRDHALNQGWQARAGSPGEWVQHASAPGQLTLDGRDPGSFGRQEEGRQMALATLLHAQSAFPQLYQTQGAVADAQARLQLEYGPTHQARTAAEAAQQAVIARTGDLDAGAREYQRVFGLHMQSQNPGQAGGADQGGAQNQPQGAGFTQLAALDWLKNHGIVNKDTGQAGELDALKLADEMYKDQETMGRMLPTLAPQMYRLGVPTPEVNKALQQALVRLDAQTRTDYDSAGSPGRYGAYTVTHSAEVPGLFQKAGAVVAGPRGAVYHEPPALHDPMTPWPWQYDFSEAAQARTRAKANQLAAMMQALDALNAGQTGAGR